MRTPSPLTLEIPVGWSDADGWDVIRITLPRPLKPQEWTDLLTLFDALKPFVVEPTESLAQRNLLSLMTGQPVPLRIIKAAS